MIRHKLLIFTILNTLSIYNCFGMELEKSDKIIRLDQGLLTTIPGKTIISGYESTWYGALTKIEKIGTRNDALINLLYYETYVKNDAPYDREYFKPLLIKLTIQQTNIFIQNFGDFYTKIRREAKEAIRQNKALYYTRKQGCLIYSLSEQPDPSICEHIDRMLEDNKSHLTISQ